MRKQNSHETELIISLLEHVPEIEGSYRAMGRYTLSDEDIEELEQIHKAHQLPERDYGQPGSTIVFETLLVPFIISLIDDPRKSRRLREIMEWIETLVTDDDIWTRSLVGTSVCAPLLSTYRDRLPEIFPFLGSGTVEMCRNMLSGYLVADEATSRLLDMESTTGRQGT